MNPSTEEEHGGETCSVEVTPGESIVHAVLEAVATASGTPREELPSLYYSIDTEALDELVAPRANGKPRSDISVEFTYHGTVVTVDERTVCARYGGT